MIKLAYDRWATSLVCLRVSAEGLSLPGMAARRIPWTDVRSVRGISCSPTPEHAMTPRQYLLFEVGRAGGQPSASPGSLWWRAHLFVLDVSELDTRKDVILDAVYRYNPAAVADADVARAQTAAPAAPNPMPRARACRWPRRSAFGAQCIRAEAAALLADCSEMWPAAVAAWHRLAPRVRREARTALGAAIALQRSTAAHAQQLAQTLRDMTTDEPRARTPDRARGCGRHPPQICPKRLK